MPKHQRSRAEKQRHFEKKKAAIENGRTSYINHNPCWNKRLNKPKKTMTTKAAARTEEQLQAVIYGEKMYAYQCKNCGNYHLCSQESHDSHTSRDNFLYMQDMYENQILELIANDEAATVQAAEKEQRNDS